MAASEGDEHRNAVAEVSGATSQSGEKDRGMLLVSETCMQHTDRRSNGLHRMFFALACLALSSLISQQPALAAGKRPRVVLPAGWPQALVIPKIGVNAPVESLALSAANSSAAPYRWGDVAWFDLGPKPGAVGRSVIFGHLDSTCCPAVFFHLGNLNQGDEVDVRYKKGEVRFKVIWRRIYPKAEVPWDWIYAQPRGRGLSLITCTGVFHYDGTGYDHRIVVYARMVLPNKKHA